MNQTKCLNVRQRKKKSLQKWSQWNMISAQEVVSLYYLLCFSGSVRWDAPPHPPTHPRKAFVVIFQLHFCPLVWPLFVLRLWWSTLRFHSSSANNRWRLEAAALGRNLDGNVDPEGRRGSERATILAEASWESERLQRAESPEQISLALKWTFRLNCCPNCL